MEKSKPLFYSFLESKSKKVFSNDVLIMLFIFFRNMCR